MVRFGNVIGSSGSVIPKFRDQIQKGGPITITDPEITRYFMTIPEAAQLVIQASSLATGGDIFILDMKEPIKIIDLAKRMTHLSGFSIKDDKNSNGDIEIQFIGLRPGEKLHEELVLGKNPINTIHEEIMKAQDPYIPWVELEKEIEKLEKYLKKNLLSEITKILEKSTNYISYQKKN
jgi:FlaA1/EpsC-like NDP-sugar epimerase